MMDGAQQSDAAVVARKAANKGARAPAEPLERRAAAERNPRRTGTVRTQSRGAVSPGAERIRQLVKEKPGERLTALLHHITPEALGEAYRALKRDAAPGVDGMTWREYGDGLEERLLDLHDRVQRGAYRAKPVRRVEIPKPDGGVRPLGIASLEDKIVQRAVVERILTPIYESEFFGFSYGFRPGRSAHDALDALAYAVERRKVSWVVEVDIRQYFDSIDREQLMQFLEMRIGDRRVLRVIRKWLNAGVIDAGLEVDVARGTPQGAVISPLLANVYLHHVLDDWFAREWRPREVWGETYIVRYEHRELGQHAVEPDADPAEVHLRLLARGMQLGDRHDRPAGLELAAHAADVGAHGRLGDTRPALVHEALPDPPRGVALLARRAEVGSQPLADRRAVRTEPRRRLRDRLARRRQRGLQRLPHRAPVHAVAVRQSTDGHAILAPVPSDMLEQLHLRQLLILRRGEVTFTRA